MISTTPQVANVYLSLCAVIGLITLFRVMAARGRWEPLNRRFLFGIRVTILLFAMRALQILTGIGVFRVFELIAAALIPVAVLILTEGLLRRHAPRWAKLFVAGTAALFSVLAVIPFLSDNMRLFGLMGSQVVGLSICGWLVLSRDKPSLSGAENTSVERLGLSLILLVPLAAVDFLTYKLGIPVQASPVGVLFLCWLAIGLGGADVRHRGSVYGFGAVVLGALCATVFVTMAWSMGRDETLVAGLIIMATMMVVAVTNEARHLRAEAQSLSLLRHMAEAEGDAMTFLRGLQSHPMVEGALVIDHKMLADLDANVLARLFADHPVLRKSEILGGDEASDYAAHLFARYDASHIFWVTDTPITLVALSMPSVAASSGTELELAAVQRMATLMTKGAG